MGAPHVATIKILLVDDEREILEEALEALTDEGYEAICANTVDCALQVLRDRPDIAVVVTDLKMPGKSGADLIEEARAEFGREITFIVMSGHGSPNVEADGVDVDKFVFLRKPLDIDAFLEAVRMAVSSNGDPCQT